MTDRVLVTGASGFLAKHIIAQLLEAGYAVRGTVRSMGRRDEIEAALARAGRPCAAALELVEADLGRDAGWAQAAEGCRYVLHVASPFPAAEPRNPDAMITTAREGTRRVVHAAHRAGVERIVQTSSIIAIMHCPKPDHVPRTEEDWSDSACGEISSYGRSKTLAERAAWEIIAALAEDGGRPVPELVVINPGVAFGPALDKDLSTSHVILRLMGRGAYPALPKIAFPVVDARDVARLHVLALGNEAARGQRYLCANQTVSLRDIGRTMVATLPDLKRKVPTIELPSPIVRLASNFDRNLRSIRGDLGKPNLCDNAKARRDFDFKFRPAEEAIEAAALSLRDLGVI